MKLDAAIGATSTIFQLHKYCGGDGKGFGKRLVAIIPSDTSKKLFTNGKRWLPDFYTAIDTSGSLDLYTVCYQLILLHRYHMPKAFEDVCRTVGAATFKMDPYRQIAMCHKANLNKEHLRIIRPFLNAENCNPFCSERQIRKLSVSPTVDPIYNTLLEKGVKRNAWYLPVDSIVKEEIARQQAKVNEIHVILSADHGQRAFRCNITTIGISNQRTIKFEKHSLVGQIQCQKDSRDVLVDSGVVAGINSALKALKGLRLPTTGSTPTEQPLSIKLKAAGDIAWYCLALGRGSTAGIHCWRCKAMAKEYQDNPFFTGEKWTLQSMKDTFGKLESGELDRKNKRHERGLKNTMLFD